MRRDRRRATDGGREAPREPQSRPGAHGHGARAREAGPTPLTSVTFREVEPIMEDPARRDAMLSQKVLGIGLITLVCLLLFVGATGKSAQIPLYVWLPDAMAGPTPVSALIHAATMVTAGVYMVARLHFLFACSPVAMTVVATVGALTALFAATIGLFQYDIKKVLAYSTVSQLGFMFLAVGVGAYWVAIFHLVTHAFFKACLFLGSGSVILGCHHEQDMRKMGGLRQADADHRGDLLPLGLRHRRLPVLLGLLLQGRDPLEGVRQRQHAAAGRRDHPLGAGRDGRALHLVLHVPLVLHDLQRHLPGRRRARATRTSAHGGHDARRTRRPTPHAGGQGPPARRPRRPRSRPAARSRRAP